MIEKNDYELELFNGDIGIIWPDETRRLRAWFPAPDNTLRHFAVAMLPRYSEAYAITVHKSQGSEYVDVRLLLPPADSLLLTREMMYTAVSRARRSLRVVGSERVFRAACQRRLHRASGLPEKLGW